MSTLFPETTPPPKPPKPTVLNRFAAAASILFLLATLVTSFIPTGEAMFFSVRSEQFLGVSVIVYLLTHRWTRRWFASKAEPKK